MLLNVGNQIVGMQALATASAGAAAFPWAHRPKIKPALHAERGAALSDPMAVRLESGLPIREIMPAR